MSGGYATIAMQLITANIQINQSKFYPLSSVDV
jgi:hypothetical protein